MPEADFSFTVPYSLNGLAKGKRLDLSWMLGMLGMKRLESVFANSARYLPENMGALYTGWRGGGPVFRKTVALSGQDAGRLEARLDFSEKAFFLEPVSGRAHQENPGLFKKAAFAEVCGLKALATSCELAGADFEGSAGWVRALAYLDPSGEWEEVYRMEAIKPWSRMESSALHAGGRMHAGGSFFCMIRENPCSGKRSVRLDVDDGFAGMGGGRGKAVVAAMIRLWAVNFPCGGGEPENVEIHSPIGLSAARAKIGLKKLAIEAVRGVLPKPLVYEDAHMESWALAETSLNLERVRC